MPPHPQVLRLREERVAAGARPVSERSVEEARADEARSLAPDTVPYEPIDAPGPAGIVPLRLYRPPLRGRDPLPALVWFFGGGWVMGSLAAAAPVCARLAEAASCAVVSVGYRRAPEHRFPAAVDDCAAATRWLLENSESLGLDPARVAVGGASAGGTLAAVVAQLERDSVPPLAFQVLVYPVTAYQSETPSLACRGDPYFLDAAAVEWVWSQYLPEGVDPDDPRISPLRAQDLRGLPPTLVVLAGDDPLHDEGLLYAERLAAAGVATEVADFLDMVHGFFSLTESLDAAAEAQARVAAALTGVFGASLPQPT